MNQHQQPLTPEFLPYSMRLGGPPITEVAQVYKLPVKHRLMYETSSLLGLSKIRSTLDFISAKNGPVFVGQDRYEHRFLGMSKGAIHDVLTVQIDPSRQQGGAKLLAFLALAVRAEQEVEAPRLLVPFSGPRWSRRNPFGINGVELEAPKPKDGPDGRRTVDAETVLLTDTVTDIPKAIGTLVRVACELESVPVDFQADYANTIVDKLGAGSLERLHYLWDESQAQNTPAAAGTYMLDNLTSSTSQ